MLRELAKMSAEEAHEWMQDRRTEAIRAYAAGTITQWILDEIIDWAEDSYTTYLFAVAEGLILPQQVEGKRLLGSQPER